VPTISLPENFDDGIARLFVFLARKVPGKTTPKLIVASMEIVDMESDEELGADQIRS